MIDAHQHCWRIGENDCCWPTSDLTGIYRHFELDDLHQETQKAGVKGTVLVQSQESDRDTDYLLRLAQASDLIKAVVGWVDLTSSVAEERVNYLAAQPKFRGLRPMLQGLADDHWILRHDIEPAIRAMIQGKLVFDALVFERHLPYLHIFARRHPELSIVIDHAAKPAIKAGGFEQWSATIAAFAELPNVSCKLSGLLTESAPEQGLDQIRPYVVHLYRIFGAERLLWGSDWPVLLLAENAQYNTYESWMGMARQLLPTTDADELEHIFALNAKRVYRL